MSTKTSNCKQKPDYLVLLSLPLLQKFSGVLMRFCQHFRKKGMSQKKNLMVMNLCPSNIKMLLIAAFDLTGVMQVGTEWIFAHLCPTELGFKSQAIVQRWQCAPSPTHLLTDWNLCHQGKKEIQKYLRNTGKRFGRSPVVQPSCSSSVSHLIRLWKWIFQTRHRPGGCHTQSDTRGCVARADMDPGDPHLGLAKADLNHYAQLSGEWERQKLSPVLG